MDQARPAFRRLQRDLRARIVAGDFPPEAPLPTEAELARTYGVSRQTVRRAFQDLVTEDLVYRIPGRGTFATPPSDRYLQQFGSIEDLMALTLESELHVLQPLTIVADPSAAGRLGRYSDLVSTISFLRLHNGHPYMYTSVFLASEMYEKLADISAFAATGEIAPLTVIGVLDDLLEDPIDEADQSITIGATTAEAANALGLPIGSPLLRIDRLYLDTKGAPVELSINSFHPSRYSYRTRLRRRIS